MKIKVISDGKPTGTRIFDVETGQDLTDCAQIEWTHKAGELPECTVRLILTEVQLETKAVKVAVCAACGEALKGVVEFATLDRKYYRNALPAPQE